MRNAICIFLCSSLLLAQTPIRGYPQADWQSRRELEEKARAIPRPDRVKVYLERMAAEPHAAGSAQSKAVADYALGLMKEFGLDAKIENFEALLPYPTARKLEMTAPYQFTARLNEPGVAEDPDSTDKG
ncbi:MAG: folate hydrolase, partial [Bryobacteraceae bacterium]